MPPINFVGRTCSSPSYPQDPESSTAVKVVAEDEEVAEEDLEEVVTMVVVTAAALAARLVEAEAEGLLYLLVLLAPPLEAGIQRPHTATEAAK